MARNFFDSVLCLHDDLHHNSCGRVLQSCSDLQTVSQASRQHVPHTTGDLRPVFCSGNLCVSCFIFKCGPTYLPTLLLLCRRNHSFWGKLNPNCHPPVFRVFVPHFVPDVMDYLPNIVEPPCPQLEAQEEESHKQVDLFKKAV